MWEDVIAAGATVDLTDATCGDGERAPASAAFFSRSSDGQQALACARIGDQRKAVRVSISEAKGRNRIVRSISTCQFLRLSAVRRAARSPTHGGSGAAENEITFFFERLIRSAVQPLLPAASQRRALADPRRGLAPIAIGRRHSYNGDANVSPCRVEGIVDARLPIA